MAEFIFQLHFSQLRQLTKHPLFSHLFIFSPWELWELKPSSIKAPFKFQSWKRFFCLLSVTHSSLHTKIHPLYTCRLTFSFFTPTSYNFNKVWCYTDKYFWCYWDVVTSVAGTCASVSTVWCDQWPDLSWAELALSPCVTTDICHCRNSTEYQSTCLGSSGDLNGRY